MTYQYVLEDIRDRTKYEPNLDELPPEIKSRVHRLAEIYARILSLKSLMRVSERRSIEIFRRSSESEVGTILEELRSLEESYKQELEVVADMTMYYIENVHRVKQGICDVSN